MIIFSFEVQLVESFLLLPKVCISIHHLVVGQLDLGIFLTVLLFKVPDLSLQFLNIFAEVSFITEMKLFDASIFWLAFWSIPLLIDSVMNLPLLDLV